MKALIAIPQGAALVRDRRSRELFLARDLHLTQREARFDGQLVVTDNTGSRLYAPRPRRLSRARVEILTSDGEEL
jgi:hypothetical protein